MNDISAVGVAREAALTLSGQLAVHAATTRYEAIPQAALDESGPAPTVTRVRDGKAERLTVEIGLRQNYTERVEITKGLTAGDVVIVGSAKGVANGTPVHVVAKN